MTYIKTKEQARQYAINYQQWSSNKNLSYAEIFAYTNTLSKTAKKLT